MPRPSRPLASLLVAAAFGLGACGDSSGPANTPLTSQSVPSVGAAAVSTTDLALAALNPSVPDFGGGFPMFFARGRMVGGGLRLSPPAAPGDCPAASNLTDTDGDGVPDNATWTFTAADCTQTDSAGNRGVVTGSVTISDPGLTAGYTLSLSDLTARFFQSGSTTPLLQLIMNGTWALRGTSDALTLDQTYNFALTAQGEQATLSNDLAVSFTAASGTAISWGVPLPDGTISINGAWRIASSQENHSLTLTTVAPLVYDDACEGIVAGVLDAQGDGGSVRVTWTGCGAHTDTFVPVS
jgi:hypothetical protein